MENFNFGSNDDKEEKPSSASIENKDDDNEDDSQVKQKKPPKRSLFFGSEKKEEEKSEEKKEESKSTEKRNLFSGLLKNEVAPEQKSDNNSAETDSNEQEKPREDPVSAFEELVSTRRDSVANEEALPDTNEEAVINASTEFLDSVSEQVSQGVEPEAAIQQAENEVIPEEVNDNQENQDEIVEVVPVIENSMPENIDDIDGEDTENAPPMPVPPVVVNTQTGPNINIPPVPPVSQRVQPAVAQVSPNTTQTYSFNTLPVSPNVYQYTPNTPPSNPNLVRNNPNVVPMNEIFYRNKRSGDILLGGVLGYLIGKRRGRIKTEKKLKPELASRDTTISDLTTKLTDAEARVRAEAAKTKLKTTTETSLPLRSDVDAKVTEKSPAQLLGFEPLASETINREVIAGDIVDTNTEVLVNNQIEQTTVEIPPSEQSVIERTLETFIPVPVPIYEAPKPTYDSSNNFETGKEVSAAKLENGRAINSDATPEFKRNPRDMSMPELLRVAEFINFENNSLRQLYDRGRIDSANLRRIVISFMNGGSRYEQLLAGALQAHEIRNDLKREIRKEEPQSGFSDSSSSGSTASSAGAVQNNRSIPESETVRMNNSTSASSFDGMGNDLAKDSKEQVDDSMLVTNGTAIALGILMGVALMILVLLYSGSI